MQYVVFFSGNNLILKKASLEEWWSGRRWLEFHLLALGVVGPWEGLSSYGPLEFRMWGIVVLGPQGSGSTRSALFSDIVPAGVLDMVGGSVGFSVWSRIIIIIKFIHYLNLQG